MENITQSTMSSVSNVTVAIPEEFPNEAILIPMVIPPRWAFNVELVMMAIVFLLGVPGNIIIIIVQAKTEKKTSTDYLVMIMAMYELLSSSINTVLKFVVGIKVLWLLVFSMFVCKATPVLYYIAQYGSALTLGMLAVDRCIKTVFPLSTWYNNKHPLIASVFIFVISVVLCSPHGFGFTAIYSTKQCGFTVDDRVINKAFGIAGSLISFIVFFIIAISYGLIAIALRRRHIKKLKQRKTQNMFKNNIIQETAGTDNDHLPTIITTETEAHDRHNDKAVESSGTSGHTAKESKPKKGGRTKMLTMEGRNVNKLTVLMFLLSLIYIGTNAVLWYLFFMGPFELGVAMLHLSFSIPMINCISNPVIFFSMSSRFRTNVKNLFRG